MEAFTAGPQRLCDPGGVYQRAELLEAIRYSGQGLAQGVLQAGSSRKKGNVLNTSPLLDQAACRLN